LAIFARSGVFGVRFVDCGRFCEQKAGITAIEHLYTIYFQCFMYFPRVYSGILKHDGISLFVANPAQSETAIHDCRLPIHEKDISV
jgi:hypothetical protein